MYEALIARIRYYIQKANFMGLKEADSTLMLGEAADAIEELSQQVEHYHGCMNDWFKAAQEYKAAYIAEHDARIAEIKKLYDEVTKVDRKRIEMTPMQIIVPKPPKEETE